MSQQIEVEGISLASIMASLASFPFIISAAVLHIFFRAGRPTATSEENEAPPRVHAPYGENVECPICLELPQLRTTTTCGHRFCSACIIRYWQEGNHNNESMQCPTCRQRVTLLVPEFEETSSGNMAENREARRQLARIAQYNAQHGSIEAATWMEWLVSAPILLSRLLQRLRRRPLATTLNLAVLLIRLRRAVPFISGVMYILSPIDLIPEALFGVFGLFDDIIVLICIAAILASVARFEIAEEITRQR